MNWVSLHTHSRHSLLDGFSSVKTLTARAAELGMSAIAITDHGSMGGTWEAIKYAKEYGIKPILGCEGYILSEGYQSHLVLLALNREGYENLVFVQNDAQERKTGRKPLIDEQLLFERNDGIVVATACLGGTLPRMILDGKEQDELERYVERYAEVFGYQFHLEIQPNGLPAQHVVNRKMVQLSEKFQLPLLATGDVHFCYKEDADAHDSMICLNTGSKKSDVKRMRYTGKEYLHSFEEMICEEWGLDRHYVEDGLRRSTLVADAVEPFELAELRMPVAKVDTDHRKLLISMAINGFNAKKLPQTPEYKDRLKAEEDLISAAGFGDYFLILALAMQWGRENGILFGPGRGSAAGCLLSYCLGITNVDPIKAGLQFERFMNPKRTPRLQPGQKPKIGNVPDIDTDIESQRRDEFISYLENEYGKYNVIRIGTVGTLKGRSALKDACRVLGAPQETGVKLASMIPNHRGISPDLQTLIEDSDSELHKCYKQHQEVIDLAVKLEGSIKSRGSHAAGVIISPVDLCTIVPVFKDKCGNLVSEWDMKVLETAGFVKYDFLGLTSLDVISATCRLAGDLPFSDRSGEDKNVYDLISGGDVAGIFQLDSQWGRTLATSIKPRSLEDISDVNALSRPGAKDTGATKRYMDKRNDNGYTVKNGESHEP